MLPAEQRFVSHHWPHLAQAMSIPGADISRVPYVNPDLTPGSFDLEGMRTAQAAIRAAQMQVNAPEEECQCTSELAVVILSAEETRSYEPPAPFALPDALSPELCDLANLALSGGEGEVECKLLAGGEWGEDLRYVLEALLEGLHDRIVLRRLPIFLKEIGLKQVIETFMQYRSEGRHRLELFNMLREIGVDEQALQAMVSESKNR